MKRRLVLALLMLATVFLTNGCLTAIYVLAAFTDLSNAPARAEREKIRAEATDAWVLEVERDPSQIVAKPTGNEDMQKALLAVLSNPDLHFSERDLRELAVRIRFGGPKQRWCSDNNDRVLHKLLARPELTSESFRALEPLVNCRSGLEYHSRSWLLADYLSNPKVPMDILALYAEPASEEYHWRGKVYGGWSDAVIRCAQRRLAERLGKGEKVVPQTPPAVLAFLGEIFDREITIPDDLEADHPVGAWRKQAKECSPWSRQEYAFICEQDKGEKVFTGPGYTVEVTSLCVLEPDHSAADWRERVRPNALTLTFATPEERTAFLREVAPVSEGIEEVPENGYDVRRNPQVLTQETFIMTAEATSSLVVSQQ